MNAKAHAKLDIRRKVIYFAGFDPRRASTYHKLTKDQFELHCRKNGMKGEVGNRERLAKVCHRWMFESSRSEKRAQTEFQFMVWDDLVRTHWIRPDWRAVLSGGQAFFRLLKFGIIADMLRTSRPIALTALGPILQIMAVLLIAVLAAYSLITFLSGSIGTGLIGICLSALAVFGVSRIMDGLNAPWVGRITSFAVATSEKPILEKWGNRGAIARHVLDTIKDEASDEILIVAHSIGTQIGLLALADATRLDAEPITKAIDGKRLCFVTLGQTVPLMSRTSSPVSDALKVVGESGIPWLDMSAPSDPACYALVDPYRNQFGKEPRVHIENARFFQAFDPDTYRKAKADRFTMHFLYLMTPDAAKKEDRRAGFDLYSLMTSADRLAEKLPKAPVDVKPFYQRSKS